MALTQPQQRLGKRRVLAIDGPQAKIARMRDNTLTSPQNVGEVLDRLLCDYTGAGPSYVSSATTTQPALGGYTLAASPLGAPAVYAPPPPPPSSSHAMLVNTPPVYQQQQPQPQLRQQQPTPLVSSLVATTTTNARTPTPIVYSPAAPLTSGGGGPTATNMTTTNVMTADAAAAERPSPGDLTVADLTTYLSGMDHSIANCRETVSNAIHKILGSDVCRRRLQTFTRIFIKLFNTQRKIAHESHANCISDWRSMGRRQLEGSRFGRSAYTKYKRRARRRIVLLKNLR